MSLESKAKTTWNIYCEIDEATEEKLEKEKWVPLEDAQKLEEALENERKWHNEDERRADKAEAKIVEANKILDAEILKAKAEINQYPKGSTSYERTKTETRIELLERLREALKSDC